MRIAFIALWSPRSPRYWSGTPHYSFNAIRREFPDVVLIDTPILDFALFYLGKIARRARIDILREPLVRWLYKLRVRRQLRRIRPDVVISVGASHKLCDVSERFRTIHVADALFASVVGSYASMSRISPRSRRLGEDIQNRFLARVDTLCLSSDWAVSSARAHYELDHCRVRTLLLGANLATDPGYDAAARRDNDRLSLLFIGGDWQRKGGPLLLEIFRQIRSDLPEAVLHIVGCEPAEATGQPGVIVHGFLDKSAPKDADRLEELFRTSAFLVVPSRQEAYGIVFCEACAYGLPPVGTRTGGITSILRDGENGMLLSQESGSEAYAERILSLWDDRAAYLEMCATSRRHFEDRLSWEAWAQGIAAEVARFY